MKHACRSPQQKSMLHVKFFPSPGRCPKSTGGDGGQNVDAPWFGSQLQPLIAINLFLVFNAQQGSRGNACASSRGLLA
jgi:hypothetical protein